MKFQTATTMQTDWHDDCPQKLPIIHQLISFVSALKPGYIPNQKPHMAITGKTRPANVHPVEFVIKTAALPATAGLARSIVFFNWKDYA